MYDRIMKFATKMGTIEGTDIKMFLEPNGDLYIRCCNCHVYLLLEVNYIKKIKDSGVFFCNGCRKFS